MISTRQMIALLSLLLAALFFTPAAHAQYTTIEQQEISISQSLAGHVAYRNSSPPAEGITVELCSSDWKTVLESTKTDKKGYFSFQTPASGKLFYLRLSAPGTDPYQLRVRIAKTGAKELTIHLTVAT